MAPDTPSISWVGSECGPNFRALLACIQPSRRHSACSPTITRTWKWNPLRERTEVIPAFSGCCWKPCLLEKGDGRIERKADDIQPLLAAKLMRAILTARRIIRTACFPRIIGRFRADGEVTYLRAALVKPIFPSCPLGKPSKEVSVSLDPSNTKRRLTTGPALCRLGKKPSRTPCPHQRNHQGPFLLARRPQRPQACFRDSSAWHSTTSERPSSASCRIAGWVKFWRPSRNFRGTWT